MTYTQLLCLIIFYFFLHHILLLHCNTFWTLSVKSAWEIRDVKRFARASGSGPARPKVPCSRVPCFFNLFPSMKFKTNKWDSSKHQPRFFQKVVNLMIFCCWEGIRHPTVMAKLQKQHLRSHLPAPEHPGAGEFIRPPWRCWAWRGRTVKTSPVTLNKASEKTWGMQRYSNEHNLTISSSSDPLCCVLISPDIKPIWICWCSSKENIQHKTDIPYYAYYGYRHFENKKGTCLLSFQTKPEGSLTLGYFMSAEEPLALRPSAINFELRRPARCFWFSVSMSNFQ